jgi:hypothetical protein
MAHCHCRLGETEIVKTLVMKENMSMFTSRAASNIDIP